jgi:chitinase
VQSKPSLFHYYSSFSKEIDTTFSIQELREKFDAEGGKLILSAAVGCRKQDIDNAYEIEEMSKYLDFINLMTYDLRGSEDAVAAHHSPLFGGINDIGEERVYNQVTTI